VLKDGRGTRLTKEEMLQFLKKAEKEGLVLQAQNSCHPIYICCCSCCCAILSRVKKLPDPGRILKSNYVAEADPAVCIGCGACIRRCPMDAIAPSKDGAEKNERRRPVSVAPERCIGCGLCFSVCPVDALQMRTRGARKEPPSSAMMMYIRMFIGRFGLLRGGFLLLKAGLGFKV
jgi:NAD-dependent dihydropyrimidine dehydrogenase PreA subunit